MTCGEAKEYKPKKIGTIKLEKIETPSGSHFFQCDWANDRMRFKHQRFHETKNSFHEDHPKGKKWRNFAPNDRIVINEGPAGKWKNADLN